MNELTDDFGNCFKIVGQDESGNAIPDDECLDLLAAVFATENRDCPDTIGDKLAMLGAGAVGLAILGGIAYAIFGQSE
jgi:hypothetical protein